MIQIRLFRSAGNANTTAAKQVSIHEYIKVLQALNICTKAIYCLEAGKLPEAGTLPESCRYLTGRNKLKYLSTIKSQVCKEFRQLHTQRGIIIFNVFH